MGWSFEIGRLFGISIRLHLGFVLLAGWLIGVGLQAGDGERSLLALGLFCCVLLHELGHALVARRFQVEVLDITLLPIGGVARMAQTPRKPMEEFWIAVAGPVVNVVLALGFHLAHYLLEPRLNEISQLGSRIYLLEQLALLNLVLAGFNLIPAFPMDGGRILRALLALRMSHTRATRTAGALGQLIAIGMAFLGLLLSPWLILIALFVFMGAASETQQAETRFAISGVPVREAAMCQFRTLRRADTIGTAADLLLQGAQQDFPVVSEDENDAVVGVLTRDRLLTALREHGRDRYVSEVMEPAPDPISSDLPLDTLFERAAQDGLPPLIPIRDETGLCGLLTRENLAEFVMIRRALAPRTDAPDRAG